MCEAQEVCSCICVSLCAYLCVCVRETEWGMHVCMQMGRLCMRPRGMVCVNGELMFEAQRDGACALHAKGSRLVSVYL